MNWNDLKESIAKFCDDEAKKEFFIEIDGYFFCKMPDSVSITNAPFEQKSYVLTYKFMMVGDEPGEEKYRLKQEHEVFTSLDALVKSKMWT